MLFTNFFYIVTVYLLVNLFVAGLKAQYPWQYEESETSTVEEETESTQMHYGDVFRSSVVINKCCERDQILDIKITCQEQTFNDFEPITLLGIVQQFVVSEKEFRPAQISHYRIGLKYNSIDKLIDRHFNFAYHWNLNESATTSKFVFSVEDGSILELEDTKKKVKYKYSTASYCLDQDNFLKKGLVAYINPCIDNVCVQKCCPMMQYFNTGVQNCVLFTGLEMIKPDYYFLTNLNNNENLRHYYTFGFPKCANSEKPRPIVQDREHPFYLQADGFLLIDDQSSNKQIFYNSSSFCVENFSSEHPIPESFINGFYCENDYNFTNADTIRLLFEDRMKSTTKSEVEFKEINKLPKNSQVSVNIYRPIYFLITIRILF